MKRWQAFKFVCDQLDATLLQGGPFNKRPPVSWELVIECASHHCVTPALSWCLNETSSPIPSDVRGYFDALFTLNTIRNESILAGVERVVKALNAIDVEPVLLKGASHLLEKLYPALGIRIVGDLDVLIQDDRALEAAAALEAIGFCGSNVHLPATHHHLPGMRDPESGLYVELHTRVDHREEVLSRYWFDQRTTKTVFRGLHVRIPDATANIGHNIIHSQLNHQGYRFSRVQLRELLDLAMIRARHEATIDWAELDGLFTAAEHGQVLATYLKIAELVFEQPSPKLRTMPRRLTLERLRVRIEEPDRQLRARHYETHRKLNEALAKLSNEHEITNIENRTLRSTLEQARSEVELLTQQRLQARSEVELLKHQLNAVHNSTSWKLTKPLRAVVRFVRGS
ncbi:MAG: nucleotidyltransferase family protein [Actinomycetota bacterium]